MPEESQQQKKASRIGQMAKLLFKMCQDLLISASSLRRRVSNAPHRYKVYMIPSRSGGQRVIAQPPREMKVIQNWLARHFLGRFPVHRSATAYMKGSSIKKNAEMHVGCDYLLKMDFAKFFNSIKHDDFRYFCGGASSNLIEDIDADDFEMMERLLFWRPGVGQPLCLSVGAPSSPKLSNILMKTFDDTMYDYCVEHNVVYTRYADDLTFSTVRPYVLERVYHFVLHVVDQMKSPKLIINHEKTVNVSKKTKRFVTGLVITNDQKLSLGRDRKRLISAMINRFRLGQLDCIGKMKLSGLIAFALDVEPDFVNRMIVKYGHNCINSVLAASGVTRSSVRSEDDGNREN
jgi:RNA-directed DNA polymerase